MIRRGTSKRKENTHISLHVIQQYLLRGGYPTGSTTLDKRSIRKRAESFKIDDGGELFYIVRPKRLDDEPPDPDPGANRLNYRKAIFTVRDQLTLAANLHVNAKGAHMGTERTLNALTSKYYWVGMSATVRKVIKSCAVCLANRPVTSHHQTSPGILEATMQGESYKNVTVSNSSVIVKSSPDKSPIEEISDIVKAEIQNLQQSSQANVHFDPNLVLRDEDNILSASQILKARRFWERVEILVLGVPDPNKERKISYLLVALDSFSKWPEALKLDTLNEKTISQLLFQLISRYGVMEQLVMLENEILRGACLVYSAISENLTMFNITVTSEILNRYDDSWIRITKNLEQFVQQYPVRWSQALDLCLLPIRMSVSSKDDYSPAYLLMNRDPKFPNSVLPERDSAHRELMLGQCQLQKAANSVMSSFLECSIPDVKRAAAPSVLISSTMTGVVEKAYSHNVRRSNRKSKKFHRLAGFDDDCKLKHHYKEDEHASDVHASGHDYTEECSSIPLKKRKMFDNLNESAEWVDANSQKLKKEDSKKISHKERITEGEETLEKIGTDIFYLIITKFLENASFPPNSPTAFKQAVKKSSVGHSLEDGKLMLCHKGVKKTVMSTVNDCVGILNEIHTLKGEHLPKSKVLDELEHRLITWRDMATDVDAFVKACPNCKHGIVRRKSTKFKKWRKDWDEDIEDDEASDDEINEGEEVGKASYDDLIWYLKKDIYPNHLTRAELVVFKKKAKNFKLVKGLLHYCPVSMSKATPRKVLLSNAERQAAMTKAHGDNHLLKAVMITELRKRYFWHAMGHDVERFIESCCQPCEIEDKDARDERLTVRTKQFQDYFQGNELQSSQLEALETLFPPPDTDVSEDAEPDAVYLSQNPIPNKPFENQIPKDTSGADCDIVMSLDEHTGLLREEGLLSKSGNVQQKVENSESEKQTHENENGAMQIIDSSPLREEVLSLNPLKIEIQQSGDATSDQDTKSKNKKTNDDIDEEDNRGNDEDDRKEVWKPPTGNKVSSTESTNATFLASKPLYGTPKKKVERLRCEICHVIVRGENNYKEHKYKHTGIKPFHCQQCPKAFTSVKGLRMHMRKHTGHRPYLCNICGRGFPRSAALRYHIKTHDRPAFVPVACDICTRKFTTEHRLQKHKRFKHPAETPVFKCEQCGQHFTAKRSLKRHQRSHDGIRRYECPHCKRGFFRKEYLNYHLESHFKDDPSRGPLSIKRRLKKRALMQQRQQAKKEPVLSIVSVDQPTGQFSQLVEVAHPQGWPEVENPSQDGQTLPAMITLDGSLRVGDMGTSNEPSTTVVMVEEPSAVNGEVQVRHFIVPQSSMQQDPQQHQQQQLELQPQQQQAVKHAVLNGPSGNEDQPRMIEVTLSTGQQHTLTLAGTNTLQVGDSSQETIQYHVECLHGETLTEADFQAIQMLAQASVLQQH